MAELKVSWERSLFKCNFNNCGIVMMQKKRACILQGSVLFVTADDMRVVLEICKGGAASRIPVSKKNILEYIELNKVKTTLGEKIFEEIKNQERNPYPRSYVIAEGKTAFQGKTQDIKFSISGKDSVAPSMAGTSQREEKKIHSLKFIKKGEMIGEETPSLPPRYGMNVFGVPVPPPKLENTSPTLGKNIHSKGGKLYASIDGALALSSRKEFNILPVKTVTKSMNRVSSQVAFDGVLVVENSIRGCSDIQCRVLICKELGLTNVKAQDDVIVLGKITDCTINCGNSVYAKEIAVSEIAVKCDTIVTDIISESKIFSGGKVVCSKDGIYSSTIKARYNVDTRNLGDVGKTNDITVGMDDALSQKVLTIRHDIEDYESKKAMLENNFRLERAKIKAKFPDVVVETHPNIVTLQKTIYALNHKVTSLESKKAILVRSFNKIKHMVYLRVRGKASAGNTITSINASMFIKAPMKAFKAMEVLTRDKKNISGKEIYEIGVFYPSSQ